MIEEKSITEFCDNEYLNYAMYVVENRALPSVIDGLKPTQRKVVYVANKIWKTGKEKPIKVFQLTGKVASDAYYHHGDASLNNAIIGMAQSFKNSMPLLKEIGQFGSLRSPDSGAPRYISTSLHENFRLLYKDFELLTPKYDEGIEIEPSYFLPIIPTVLLNGSSGIAVGFATNILNRNIKDLINACLDELHEDKVKSLKPWINGFTGKVERDEFSNNRWKFTGTYEIVNTSTVKITELPPSMTYEKYEKYLNGLVDKKIISSYDDNCSDKIEYVIKFQRTNLTSFVDKESLSQKLKLEEYETENLTTLDENGNLKIFNSVTEIIKYFVKFRLTYYQKRKEYILNKLEHEIKVLDNKAKFIKGIIDGTIKINKVPKDKIIEQLDKQNFDKIDDSYNYLLYLPIHSLTKEKYEELLSQLKEKKEEYKEVKKRTPEGMYEEDLITLKKSL